MTGMTIATWLASTECNLILVAFGIGGTASAALARNGLSTASWASCTLVFVLCAAIGY